MQTWCAHTHTHADTLIPQTINGCWTGTAPWLVVAPKATFKRRPCQDRTLIVHQAFVPSDPGHTTAVKPNRGGVTLTE